MKRFLLPTLSLIVVAAAAPAPAPAATADRADAAMRKGIRDFARVGVDGSATASRISVDCKPVIDVGQKGKCTGTFALTKNGRTATYTLTSSARTLRIAESAIEYRLASKAARKVKGLPSSTGSFSGFFQGPAARET
jgi:hypothetical protein